MRLSVVLTVLALAGVAGCVPTTPPMVVPATFDQRAGAWIMERGRGSISGQAFLRQRGGGIVTCAGALVEAVPVTAYSIERMRLMYQSTEQGVNRDRIIERAPLEYDLQVRSSQCDAQGNYRISELPVGDYFIVTRVTWSVGNRQQGGSIMRRVRLAAGQNVDLILTAP
jgi:hypothetical protein